MIFIILCIIFQQLTNLIIDMLKDEVQSGFQPEQPQFNSQAQPQEEESVSNSKVQPAKKYLPQEFNKAKRTLNKLITSYLNVLKEQIGRGATLFLDKSRIQGITNAISYYVGVRYKQKKRFLQLNLQMNEQSKIRQQRNGLFSYLAQSEKIINYNLDGKTSIIELEKGKFKLPNIATPVPFQNNIYLLDPCRFDQKRKVFVPSPPALVVSMDGKLKEAAGILIFRNKCAIVRDKQYIYLIGGYANEQKILTNRCQKYNTKTGKSQEMVSMTFKHKCPTACIFNKKIWVFSSQYLQFYEKEQWSAVQIPFAATFLPFQFVIAINEDQVMIFGGISNNEKSSQIKVYNARWNYLINYGPILPQGVCNQRSWGPCLVQGSVAVLSSIQASVYPQIGIKSNMSEVIYIHESSAYINCILNV